MKLKSEMKTIMKVIMMIMKLLNLKMWIVLII